MAQRFPHDRSLASRLCCSPLAPVISTAPEVCWRREWTRTRRLPAAKARWWCRPSAVMCHSPSGCWNRGRTRRRRLGLHGAALGRRQLGDRDDRSQGDRGASGTRVGPMRGIQEGKLELIQALLARGADPDAAASGSIRRGSATPPTGEGRQGDPLPAGGHGRRRGRHAGSGEGGRLSPTGGRRRDDSADGGGRRGPKPDREPGD